MFRLGWRRRRKGPLGSRGPFGEGLVGADIVLCFEDHSLGLFQLLPDVLGTVGAHEIVIYLIAWGSEVFDLLVTKITAVNHERYLLFECWNNAGGYAAGLCKSPPGGLGGSVSTFASDCMLLFLAIRADPNRLKNTVRVHDVL